MSKHRLNAVVYWALGWAFWLGVMIVPIVGIIALQAIGYPGTFPGLGL